MTAVFVLFRLAVALAVLLAACGGPSRRPGTEEQRLHLTSAGEVMGPYVPAGTVFTVELWEEPIRSDSRFEGRRFLLNMRDALNAPDGTNVVRLGAFIHATVVRASGPPNAVVVVDLTTVRTMQGDVPIAVRLASGAESPDHTVYDFVLTPARADTDVVLEPGARLSLVLTRPLVPIGSTYR